jgi:hypothetical protein
MENNLIAHARQSVQDISNGTSRPRSMSPLTLARHGLWGHASSTLVHKIHDGIVEPVLGTSQVPEIG